MALSWQMETGDDGKLSCQMLTDMPLSCQHTGVEGCS